jgi:hypothetical protein
MKRILFVVALGLWTCSLPAGELIYSNHFAFKGVAYEEVIDPEVLDKAPKWSPDKEYPPISPRKAESAAVDYVSEKLDAGKWDTEQIQLVHCLEDRWYYVVKLHPPGPPGGFYFSVQIVVLMDGAVVPLQQTQKDKKGPP